MIDVAATLRLHGMWLRGEGGGTRADLSGADLTGAHLTGADLSGADLSGADLTDAHLTGADLTGADLTGANLTDAHLSGANLTDAHLSGADLSGAHLTGALRDLLAVSDLHIRMLAAIEAGGVLEMGSWHLINASCGTQHCRAGWNIHLAGPAGAVLEVLWGPAAAGAIIAVASCPYLERVPDFYCSNRAALADIKRCAEIERAAHAKGVIP